MAINKIHIHAKVDASVQKTWEYYTDPKRMVHWNFASDDWCCPAASSDFRVGGSFKARMEAKDKSQGFDLEGQYNRILPEELLCYQMLDGREVEIVFSMHEKLTKIDLTFEAENQNPLEMQRAGWQAILNNFKNYTESN